MLSNLDPRLRLVRMTFPAGADAPTGMPHHNALEPRRAQFCTSIHLAGDDLIRLLACIEREGGVATVDRTYHAPPDVALPALRALDLRDADIPHMDLSAPFDGCTSIRHRD